MSKPDTTTDELKTDETSTASDNTTDELKTDETSTASDNTTDESPFALAQDGSICLKNEVKEVNKKIKAVRDQAQKDLEAREAQNKKLNK